MTYHISKKVASAFAETVTIVKNKLAEHGFGILSEINVTSKLQEKLGVSFRNYLILGACNPPYAYEALQAEPYIGTMLPCNVVIQEWDDGSVEVSAIDPLASMMAVQNPGLGKIAQEIQGKLRQVIADL
ncbi:DUF302 domain-containing protein [Pelobacter seleniigenes]|uniref:DUF302 domain-containing protein n=1 Tax=Pelobacter seleniigenes TaxID=407188 RepID=UPI0004A7037F|nr:DUF302 domain-containing protein [Pelobacter seleniigenes]